jgi:hypothetical protein
MLQAGRIRLVKVREVERVTVGAGRRTRSQPRTRSARSTRALVGGCVLRRRAADLGRAPEQQVVPRIPEEPVVAGDPAAVPSRSRGRSAASATRADTRSGARAFSSGRLAARSRRDAHARSRRLRDGPAGPEDRGRVNRSRRTVRAGGASAGGTRSHREHLRGLHRVRRHRDLHGRGGSSGSP